MEDIIIWIVFIAIGALWEFVGKKKSDSRSRAGAAAPAPMTIDPDSRPSSPKSSQSASHRPEKPKPAYRPMTQADAEPVSEVEILSDTPLLDTPLTSDIDTPPYNTGQPDAARHDREAHFRRWRQAIIDTQVLERKF